MIDAGFQQFADRWNPILDVFGECGVRFGLEVHPTEIAFDIYSAEAGSRRSTIARSSASISIRAICFGRGSIRSSLFANSPTASIHVHVKDAIVTLNGKSGHPREPPQLWRPAARLGLPFAGTRWREFRRDHPHAERHRLRRPALGRMGRHRHGARLQAPRKRANFCNRSTSPQAIGRSIRRFRNDRVAV